MLLEARERATSIADVPTHDLPEREFSEEDQQVAIKRDESTSLRYSPFVRN